MDTKINPRYITVWHCATSKGVFTFVYKITAVIASPNGNAFPSAVFKKLPFIFLVSDSMILIKDG